MGEHALESVALPLFDSSKDSISRHRVRRSSYGCLLKSGGARMEAAKKQWSRQRKRRTLISGAILMLVGVAAVLSAVVNSANKESLASSAEGDRITYCRRVLWEQDSPPRYVEPRSTTWRCSASRSAPRAVGTSLPPPPLAVVAPGGESEEPAGVGGAQPTAVFLLPAPGEKKEDGESIPAIITAAGGALAAVLGALAMLLAVLRNPAGGVVSSAGQGSDASPQSDGFRSASPGTQMPGASSE